MQHVLICLDCSELSKKVIPYAVNLARGFGAKLTVLHVLEKSSSDVCTPMDCVEWEIQKNEVIRYLDSIKTDIGNDGIVVTTEIMEGRPAEQINFWIKSHDVDLTVLCSHGSNGKSQWSLASTTQKLIAGTSSAILLIPAELPEKLEKYYNNTRVLLRRLLVPLDGSSWAESALPFAINIANYQHCEVELAHVIPESGVTSIEPLNSEGLVLEQHILQYNLRVASHYLKQIESRLKSTTNIPVNTSLISDHGISHQLIKLIHDKAIDMVVMSAHGNSNHPEHYCGKVALDFLEQCPIPVMLLRGQMSQRDTSVKANYSSLESTLRLPSQAVL